MAEPECKLNARIHPNSDAAKIPNQHAFMKPGFQI
jgi:hypothetical protein